MSFHPIIRNLVFFRRTNLPVALGCSLACAVLFAALAVGNSVRGSLAEHARLRLGQTQSALIAETPFPADLADRLADPLPNARVAPVLLLPATAARSDESARVHAVQAIGCDERFFQLAPNPQPLDPPGPGFCFLNPTLARRLNLQPGEDLVLTVPRPSPLSRDAPLVGLADASASLLLRIERILTPQQFASFSLAAESLPTPTMFCNRSDLARAVDQPGKANLLLLAGDLHVANRTIPRVWTLADLGLRIRTVRDGRCLQLTSTRALIAPPVEAAARKALPQAHGALTWLVERLSAQGQSSPYPFVAAVQPGPAFAHLVPADLADNEIVVNDCLAQDLRLAPGDDLTLHDLPGLPTDTSRKPATFRVRAVIALDDLADEAALMPDYPGLADVESCSQWDDSLPIDLDAIRPKDEAYWQDHRGTPKAFITLPAGLRRWSNRFGNLTALRWRVASATGGPPAEENHRVGASTHPPDSTEAKGRAPSSSDASIKASSFALLAELSPREVGLVFRDVRTPARRAVRQALDFRLLFLGLSFFLILAALLLLGVLLSLSMQMRHIQLGTLLAVGYRPGRLRRWLLAEGSVLTVVGVVLGLPAGWGLTKLTLRLLATAWAGAVASNPVTAHLHWTSPLLAAGAILLVSLLVMHRTTARLLRRPARELLDRAPQPIQHPRPRSQKLRRLLLPAILLLLAATAVLSLALDKPLLAFALAAGLYLPATVLFWGLRIAGRRPGRQTAAFAMLLIGTFLTLAVNAFRINAADQARNLPFNLYAESSLPVQQPLAELLDPDRPADLRVAALRLRPGDHAGCLNLNRPQAPRILSLPADGPNPLAGLAEDPEELLGHLAAAHPDGAIPALADKPTADWALHVKPGQTFRPVPGGPTFRLIATVPSSVFQGSVLIAEERFVELFPDVEGQRVFLIAAPPGHSADLAAQFSRAGADHGLAVTTLAERLGRFAAVQNTYLDIFSILGLLAVWVGLGGFAIMAFRNAAEARDDLAALWAVGFTRTKLQRALLRDNVRLVVAAAGSALAPVALMTRELRGLAVPVTLAIGIAAVGAALAGLAAWRATAGNLLDTLRNE